MLKIFLTKAVLGAVARHFMTTSGGVLVAQGLTDASGVQAMTGGAVALAGVIWSLINKRGLI